MGLCLNWFQVCLVKVKLALNDFIWAGFHYFIENEIFKIKIFKMTTLCPQGKKENETNK